MNLHDIVENRLYLPVEIAIDEGLVLSPPRTADPALLLNEPGWTLFDFDYDRGLAFFVDVGPDADLFRAPFCYNAQLRLGRRVASLPFEEFVRLADGIAPSNRIIHFYNIGHCGSTLLHHAINASGEAWSLSEPQFSMDLAIYRAALPRERQIELARAGLAFLSLYPQAHERSVIVLKHFSQCTKIFGVWPRAKSIYMYRDAFSWINSMYGFAQRMGMPVPFPHDMRHFVWMIQTGGEPELFLEGLVEFDREGIRFEELAACAWALHMQEFRAARLDTFPFRYNELMSGREAVLKSIFTHCGFDPARVAGALAAFDQDAHEGERTSHDRPVQKLAPSANARIAEILAHPRIGLYPELRL